MKTAILIIMLMVFEGDAQPVVHNVEFNDMKSCQAAARTLENTFNREVGDTSLKSRRNTNNPRYFAIFDCVEK